MKRFISFVICVCCSINQAIAEAIPAMGEEAAGLVAPRPSFTWMNFVPMAMIFGVMYFFVIRPQQKRMKETQSMISSLVAGQKVVMNSGIIGEIKHIEDRVVTLTVSPGVNIQMLKHQIAGRFDA